MTSLYRIFIKNSLNDVLLENIIKTRVEVPTMYIINVFLLNSMTCFLLTINFFE